MDDNLKKKLAEQLARKPTAMDTLREFLQYRVWGAEPEDVQRGVIAMLSINPYYITQVIDAIDHLTSADLPAGTLSQLVMIDGNQMLMYESDDGARTWLRELAAQMRGWTGG